MKDMSYEEWRQLWGRGLSYPESFQDLMAVVARWGRARQTTPEPGFTPMEWLAQSAEDLEAAQAILREVWDRAERAGKEKP